MHRGHSEEQAERSRVRSEGDEDKDQGEADPADPAGHWISDCTI